MDIKELQERKASLVAEQHKILELSISESRDMTAEENDKYEKIEKDYEILDKQIEKLRNLKELDAKLDEKEIRKVQPILGNLNNTWEQRGSKNYTDAFWAHVRNGRHNLSDSQLRSLTIGTAAAGGNLVPTEFEKTLIEALNENNVIRSVATVISTANDRQIPIESSYGAATWVAEEASTVTGTDPVFAQITLSAHKMNKMTKVSEELLGDSAFNIQNYLASNFGRAFGDLEETGFVTGTGTGQPTGLTTRTTTAGTVTGAMDENDILDLFYAVKSPYARKGTWLMQRSVAKLIRKFADTTGRFLWTDGLNSAPNEILGRPVLLSESMPDITAANKHIVFGDISFYWIADRSARSLQRLDELYAANGQVGFRMHARVDGNLLVQEAVYHLVSSGS